MMMMMMKIMGAVRLIDKFLKMEENKKHVERHLKQTGSITRAAGQ